MFCKALPGDELRFPRQVEVFYEGRLPDGAAVKAVEGVGAHRFRLYFVLRRRTASPGSEKVFEDPARAAMVAYIYPERGEIVDAAEDCLPRMRNVGL